MKTRTHMLTGMLLILIGLTNSVAHAAPKKSSNTALTYMCTSNNARISAAYGYQGKEPVNARLTIAKKSIYLNRNMDVTPNEMGYRFTNADGYEWTTDQFNKSNAAQAKGHMLMVGKEMLVNGCSI